jgi:NDP-sugar pyrophosphorylase family protein
MHFVILAAGIGRRMHPLTEDRPKALLPFRGRTLLSRFLDQIGTLPGASVTVVAGFERAKVEAEIAIHPLGHAVRVVHNPRYLEDTNILSVKLALEADCRPCTIIEADVLLTDACFAEVAATPAERSVWYTAGRFDPSQLGGILRADGEGRVVDLRVVPRYEPAWAEHRKLVGLLKIGPGQLDRYVHELARAAEASVQQYYLAPWIDHLAELESYEQELTVRGCRSFNTVAEFESALATFDA